MISSEQNRPLDLFENLNHRLLSVACFPLVVSPSS
jgi:hypothetical protein